MCNFCGKAQFCPKLCRDCASPQNFHTRKLGEITAFCAVGAVGKTTKLISGRIEFKRTSYFACDGANICNFFSFPAVSNMVVEAGNKLQIRCVLTVVTRSSKSGSQTITTCFLLSCFMSVNSFLL